MLERPRGLNGRPYGAGLEVSDRSLDEVGLRVALARWVPRAADNRPPKLRLNLGPGHFGPVWTDPGLVESTKSVGLVRDDAKTVLANPHLTDALELTHRARLTPQSLERLDALFAYETSPPGAEPEQQAIATRYSDKRRGRPGGVRGDGRAVLRGELVIPQAMGPPKVVEVGAKGGVVTELQPIGAAGDNHFGGTMPVGFAVKDAIVASILEANGVRAERFVASQVRAGGQGRIVRAGDFERLAHLHELLNQPQALRTFLERLGDKLALELGRSTRLTMDGLYKVLVTRKAADLADLFWLGIGHGSTTYDNIGLLQHVDVSNMASYDRLHVTNVHELAPGLAHEASDVLRLFSAELYRFAYEAGRPGERFALGKVDYESFASQELERQLAGRLLEHLGMDDDDARRLMKHHRPQVMHALQEVMRLFTIQEPGGTVPLPATLSLPIQDPARYAFFPALPALAAAACQPPGAEDLTAVVQALAPLSVDAARDEAVARALIDALRPLMQACLGPLSGEVRGAKVELLQEQALLLNAPLGDLSWNPLHDRMREILAAIDGGELERANAQLRLLVRRNTRGGPGTAMQVAMDLRHRAIQPDAEGWLSLSRVIDNGVVIEEQSHGDRDRLVVLVDPALVGAEAAASARLRLSWGAGRELVLSPVEASAEQLRFVLELNPGEPVGTIAAIVTDEAGQARADNAGLSYGAGYRPLLASGLISAELAVFAKLRGLKRPGADVLEKAVAGADRSRRIGPSLPRRLRHLETDEELRALILPASPLERRRMKSQAGER